MTFPVLVDDKWWIQESIDCLTPETMLLTTALHLDIVLSMNILEEYRD